MGCNGPFVLLPGGALEGSTVATPDSWSSTDEVDTVQLESRPAVPYSVNIWVIALGEHLYVHAEASRSTWVEKKEANPSARVLRSPPKMVHAGAKILAAANCADIKTAFKPGPGIVLCPTRYKLLISGSSLGKNSFPRSNFVTWRPNPAP